MPNTIEPYVEQKGRIEPHIREREENERSKYNPDLIKNFTVWGSSVFITMGGYFTATGIVEKVADYLGFYARDMVPTSNIVAGAMYTLFGLGWYDGIMHDFENLKRLLGRESPED